jgi:hypothetical protein
MFPARYEMNLIYYHAKSLFKGLIKFYSTERLLEKVWNSEESGFYGTVRSNFLDYGIA